VESYLHDKGENPESLLTEGMSLIFHNQVPTYPELHVRHLYNPERQNGCNYEKEILDIFWDKGLFEIYTNHINPVEFPYKNQVEKAKFLNRLKEHDTEGEDLLKSFADVIHTIRQAGYEVVIGKELEGENYIPSITAKAYVPEWNLILTTSSQNISTILNTFAQRNKRVCVIHGQKNENVPSKVLAYLVQRKKFFFDTYEFVVEENFKRATEACKQFILQCKSKYKTQSMDRGEKA